tara:strand:- start:1373 stop:2602 length:1230 start_codon:yes stop_codon:yes gene_type:complete
MKHIGLTILLLTLLLVNTFSVNADSLYLQDTIKGANAGGDKTKTYTIDGNTYTLYIAICIGSPIRTSIRINEEPTGGLLVSDTYDLNDNYYIKIDSIDPDYCDGRRFCNIEFEAYCVVDFSIFSRKEIPKETFCGDYVCEGDEDCDSCRKDCGSCPRVCGDGTCDRLETCGQDNCCYGEKRYVMRDPLNCGTCGNECNPKETCQQGKCVQVCGNGVCESNEDCTLCYEDCPCGNYEKCRFGSCITYCGNNICESDEDCSSCESDCGKCSFCGDGTCQIGEDCSSCEVDCKCENGYDCFNKECIKPECNTDIDCDDNNACTADTCSETPKECFNKKTISGCNFEDSCILIGTRTDAQYCDIEHSMKDLKSEGNTCNNNYECSSNVCVNNQCISGNLIQKIISWFRRLFKS